jgi:energy-coupling factor transporter transmembrane protein EcfT
MNKTLKKIVLFASVLIVFFFILFVINQTAQVVQLAGKVSLSFGNFVFWALLLVYAILLFIPIFLFLSLPRPLTPPKSEGAPEFNAYLAALKKRLVSNSNLKGLELSSRQQVEEALSILGKKSDEIIQETASTVFISTAISQSGRLDAFLVLSAQSRMIWRIARLYYQRPTLRDLFQLYANVAGTAFLASEFEDIDISEQVEPVLSSTLGALAVAIPGVQLAASILVNSVLTGTANAFLTLRVGIIARRYCGSLVLTEKRALRRAASTEAAKLLGSIVKQGTTKLSKALWKASKGKVGGLFSGMKEYAREAGSSLLAKVGLQKTKEALDAEIEAIPSKAIDRDGPGMEEGK